MFLDFLNPNAHSSPDDTPGHTALFTEADFLPYACHLDPHTLLTKNGELLQILRISTDAEGRNYESATQVPLLRDALRAAAIEHANTQSFALWFHTLRRRAPLDHAPEFAEPAARALHEAWQKAHPWTHSFRNEVYISLLHRGQTAQLFNLKDFKAGLFATPHRRAREAYLEEALGRLNAASEGIVASLGRHFRAERLGVAERGGMPYSEPLEFLHTLINLTDGPMAMLPIDASRQLTTRDITFGFDMLESRTGSDRRFAAMLSLKGSPELPPAVLDRCLQLPEELIITQTVNFLAPSKAMEKKEKIRDALESGSDEAIFHAAGLTELLAGDDDAPAEFVEQHTSILVARDQYAALDEAVGRMQRAFGTLGLITVREDIMLEEAFWAQLPGNFEFIRRKSTIPASRMGGLVRLNHFPCGEGKSPWGGPVAILPTTLETPYAFHFHTDANGHTAVFDFNSFTDAHGAVLVNFLSMQARQYGGRLFVLDRHFSSRPLVQALNGTYFQPTNARRDMPKNVSLNPFCLDDTPRNRAFLATWLSHFLHEDHSPALRGALERTVAELFDLPAPERHARGALARLIRHYPAATGVLAEPDAELFDDGPDTLDFTGIANGVELAAAASKKHMALPLFSYLLHRIILTLDGTPAIIVVHEAWEFMDNPFFAARIASLLDMLSAQGAVMLLTTRRPAEHAGSDFTRALLPRLSSTFFLPDDIPADYLAAGVSLTGEEEHLLSSLERQKGEFLLRHGAETLACVLPTAGLDAHLGLLSGDATALRLAQLRQHVEY